MFEGLTVLNETGGGFSMGTMVGGIIFGVVALFFIALFIYAICEGEGEAALGGFVIAAVFVLISTLLFTEMYTTKQYEVTLAPTAVIDATKWDIVEQRGDIYVLEPKVDVEVVE